MSVACDIAGEISGGGRHVSRDAAKYQPAESDMHCGVVSQGQYAKPTISATECTDD